ncbi:MAG: glycosyltransferase, partial [Candidatus Omnitrophota bacterium]
EAQAHGKPVIAFARGGALETVIPLKESAPTGVFFHEQTALALNKAIDAFEESKSAFCPEKIKENALRFGRDRFKREIHEYIKSKWEENENPE